MATTTQTNVSWGTDNYGDYPPELTKNMRPDDEVRAFIRIENFQVKGCLKKKRAKNGPTQVHFLAITRERVIGTFEDTITTKSGRFSSSSSSFVSTINIPIAKVTSITTTASASDSKGCLSKSKEREYRLVLNAQGQVYSAYTGVDSTVNDEFIRSFLENSDYF